MRAENPNSRPSEHNRPTFWLTRWMAELNVMTVDRTADAAVPASVSGPRTLVHLLLHFSWAVVFPVGSLAYLASASSTADINVWGVRVLSLMALGLAGSLLIHCSWWGRKQWLSISFWLSWWGGIFADILLGVPVALRLAPL